MRLRQFPKKIAYRGAVSCFSVSLVFLMLASIVSDKTFSHADTSDDDDNSVVSGGRQFPAAKNLASGNPYDTGTTGTPVDDAFFTESRTTPAALNGQAILARKTGAVSRGPSPIKIDEAYIRADLGKLDIEGGLLKVSWGKTSGRGPLDVVNPHDFTDLSSGGFQARKIARPMIHGSYAIGTYSMVECVFLPTFEGNAFAHDGRWVPAQVKKLPQLVRAADLSSRYPETSTLDYAQAGLRYTTTIGRTDVGFQYYYGYLPNPAITVDTRKLLSGSSSDAISIDFNRYTQLGADCSTTVGNLNVRSELAANITEDLDGADGSIYNPAVLWFFGIDRDFPGSLNLGAQAAGSVRLMNDRIGDTVSDTEAGTSMTKTTVMARLSKKIVEADIELGATAIVGLEDADCLFMPSLVWSSSRTEIGFSAGFFEGNPDGGMGQYDDNDYIKLSLTRRF